MASIIKCNPIKQHYPKSQTPRPKSSTTPHLISSKKTKGFNTFTHSQSNIQHQNQNPKENDEGSETLSILNQLFNHYSNNEPLLSSANYIKLMSDAKLIDKSLNQKYSEVLFFSASKAKDVIPFQSFCNIVLKLAEMKYQSDYVKDQSIALNKLLLTFFEPLLMIISKDSNSSGVNWRIIISRIVAEGNSHVIEENYLFFYQLYQKYFCFEHLSISHSQKSHLSKRAFIKLFRDFLVCPNYISLSQLNEIFSQCLENSAMITEVIGIIFGEVMIKMNSNIGNVFTLYHLVASFYLISVYNLLVTSDKNDTVLFVNENDTLAFKKLIMNVLKTNSIENIIDANFNVNENQQSILNGNQRNNNSNNNGSLNASVDKSNTNPNLNINKYNCNSFSNINNASIGNMTRMKTDKGLPLKKSFTSRIINPYEEQCYFIDEIAEKVFIKYELLLINTYKFYSELFYEVSFSIFMSQKGFIKFIHDIGLAVTKEMKDIPNIPHISQTTKLALQSKLQNNLLSFFSINLIFSKFSYVDKNQNSKKYSNDSNKRIAFGSFIHIILCIANKLYNPDFSSISYNDKSFNIEYLTTGKYPLKYFYAFVENYLLPLYSDIRTFIEDEAVNLNILQTVFNQESLKGFINKLTPSITKMLLCYTDGKSSIYYDQFYHFLSDFEIFPDLITRAKISRILINFIPNFDREKIVKGDNNIRLNVSMAIQALMFIAIGSNVAMNDKEDLYVKIVYFIQRMVQSKGIQKVILHMGSRKAANDFISVFNYNKKIIEENHSHQKSSRALLLSNSN